MALYVAYRKVGSKVSVQSRLADPSANALREKIRKQRAGTEWLVYRYEVKWTIASIAQAIEDSTEIEAEGLVGEFEVKESGRVQMRRGSGAAREQGSTNGHSKKKKAKEKRWRPQPKGSTQRESKREGSARPPASP